MSPLRAYLLLQIHVRGEFERLRVRWLLRRLPPISQPWLLQHWEISSIVFALNSPTSPVDQHHGKFLCLYVFANLLCHLSTGSSLSSIHLRVFGPPASSMPSYVPRGCPSQHCYLIPLVQPSCTSAPLTRIIAIGNKT